MSAVEKEVLKVRITQASGGQVDFVWDKLEPLIERGMRHSASDRTTSRHIRAKVKFGQSQMWVAHREMDILGMVIVSIMTYPNKKTVCVELTAGREIHLWQNDIENLLSDFKDLIGADSVEAYCRQGAIPKLNRWRTKAVLMELDNVRV